MRHPENLACLTDSQVCSADEVARCRRSCYTRLSLKVFRLAANRASSCNLRLQFAWKYRLDGDLDRIRVDIKKEADGFACHGRCLIQASRLAMYSFQLRDGDCPPVPAASGSH